MDHSLRAWVKLPAFFLRHAPELWMLTFNRQKAHWVPVPPCILPQSLQRAGLEKVSFHPNPRKGNAKEPSNYRTTALISHASKAMLKILQARLQQYMNCELLDVQAGFRKCRDTRDQIANICWIIEKVRVPEKHLLLLYWLPNLWLCGPW